MTYTLKMRLTCLEAGVSLSRSRVIASLESWLHFYQWVTKELALASDGRGESQEGSKMSTVLLWSQMDIVACLGVSNIHYFYYMDRETRGLEK